ncbi:ankyrin repeat domain-containing protein [Flavobacteriaceae bacterium AU392]|nr:ankyrin repeat domain-containing protein [Flavobacteriaceae bacterium]RKM85112.1 ankyrin repeat domain-containing protein [Flavobacteriaceae bacterium AU392]
MKYITLLLFVIVFNGSAQNTNVFLDRAFWKANPSIDLIDKEIAKGNNILEFNQSTFNGLSYAILDGVDNETIKHIFKKEKVDVNMLTHDARTYIFWAASRNNVELMEFLIKNGAKLDIKDSNANTVLNYAALNGQTNPKLYDLLISNGVDIKEEKTLYGANALLLVAPYVKDFKEIEYFISKGIDINTTDTNGNGIFNYVARSGNTKMLNTLIKKGVSYKKPNKEGGNAMFFASQGLRRKANSLEFFKYLESLGIKPNTITDKGESPLHTLAFRSNDKEVFNYFINKGVDVNQANNEGNTAFMNAVRRNNLEIVSFLSTYLKDINNTNNKGVSSLALAIRYNTPEIVEFIINKEASIEGNDAKGNNIGYYLINSYSSARKESFESKLKLLQSKNFDFNTPQESGSTLLHIALDKNNLDLLKYLQAFKIDVNTINDEGVTILHKAVMTAKDDKIIKYLIAIGADKNIKTSFEESVFDLASENELLQKNNIDISFLK